jgi:hypothetical protein
MGKRLSHSPPGLGVNRLSAPGISPDVHIGLSHCGRYAPKVRLDGVPWESCDSLESGLKRTHNQLATEQQPNGTGKTHET